MDKLLCWTCLYHELKTVK